MKLEARDVALVLGMRGCGKSTFAQKVVDEHTGRVIVWDPHGEYRLEQFEFSESTAPALAMRLDAPGLRVAIVPEWRALAMGNGKQSRGPMARVSDAFEMFSQLVQTTEDTLLVVDEVGMLQGRAQDCVAFIATQSRHWGIPLMLVAQRAVQIPPTAREQATRIVSYRQKRPEDIAALAERMGDKANDLPTLPPHSMVEWSEAEDFTSGNAGGDKKS